MGSLKKKKDKGISKNKENQKPRSDTDSDEIGNSRDK